MPLKNIEQLKAYKKTYYLNNKDNIKKYQSKYYLKNKEKFKEINRLYKLNNKEFIKEYLLKNKEKISKQRKQYYLNNAEKQKKYTKNYTLNNKDKIKEYHLKNPHTQKAITAKRRALKLTATPKFADLNKIKDIYKNCPKGYHVDHIVPLQGKEVCGLHVEWNLQYLTPSENSSKSNKLINDYL